MTLKSVDTLLDVLHFADSHTAVIVPELGIRVSYDSLRQQVLAMADALAAAGIRRGDRVAIVLPNGLPAIVSFLAASIAGTAAPLNPSLARERYSQRFQRKKPSIPTIVTIIKASVTRKPVVVP